MRYLRRRLLVFRQICPPSLPSKHLSIRNCMSLHPKRGWRVETCNHHQANSFRDSGFTEWTQPWFACSGWGFQPVQEGSAVIWEEDQESSQGKPSTLKNRVACRIIRNALVTSLVITLPPMKNRPDGWCKKWFADWRQANHCFGLRVGVLRICNSWDQLLSNLEI